MKKIIFLLFIPIFFTFSIVKANAATDPLPSWNDGPTKNSIFTFVNTTTDKNNPNYVSPKNRIATFDQDGTLWVEQPIYTQIQFAFDQLKTLAPQHPEWKKQYPYSAVLSNNPQEIIKLNSEDLEKIVEVTHTGMSVEAFQNLAKTWTETVKNKRWNKYYTDLVYQPMLELMNLLRANGYQIYIVTGADQEFVRAYAEHTFHVPLEKIIGSTFNFKYNENNNNSTLFRVPKRLLDNNFSGKAEDIYLFLGRSPQAAFGNSTGDQQMLEYAQTGKGPHLLMLIHHDDANREFAYDTNSKIGPFPESLMKKAKDNGWIVVSMKNDWNKIFKFDPVRQ